MAHANTVTIGNVCGFGSNVTYRVYNGVKVLRLPELPYKLLVLRTRV